jgi:hypothetical protein
MDKSTSLRRQSSLDYRKRFTRLSSPREGVAGSTRSNVIPRRIAEYFRIVAWNVALLLLGLVVIEAGFGRWFGQSALDRAYLLCDARILYKHDLFGPKVVTRYTKNSDCFRDTSERPIELVLIGGSTTDQRYLDDSETWDTILQARLRDAGMPLGFANAGVDGQSTFGHLWNFDHWFPYVKNFRPRYFLFYFGINDRVALQPTIGDLSKDENSLLGKVKRNIANNSALYQVYKTLKGMRMVAVAQIGHTKVDFDSLHYTDRGLIDDWDRYDRYLHGPFASRVRQLALAVRKMGAKPIFVTQRSRFWKNEGPLILGVDEEFSGQLEGSILRYNGWDIHGMEAKMSAAILEICRESDAVCIDGFSNLDFASDETYDFEHANPKGAQRIADFLASALQPILAADVH